MSDKNVNFLDGSPYREHQESFPSAREHKKKHLNKISRGLTVKIVGQGWTNFLQLSNYKMANNFLKRKVLVGCFFWFYVGTRLGNIPVSWQPGCRGLQGFFISQGILCEIFRMPRFGGIIFRSYRGFLFISQGILNPKILNCQEN